ncbi:hypothetical protein HOG47_02705 [archaeon]|nr:hypothetical protein [archaeon]
MDLIYVLLILSGIMYYFKDKYNYFFNYHENYIRSSIYIVFGSFPILFLLDVKINFLVVLFSIILFIVISRLMFFLNGTKIKQNIKSGKYMSRSDIRFQVTKFFEIIWQQSFVYFFCILALDIFGANIKTVLIFGIGFFVAHFITFIFQPFYRAVIYTILSFFGGVVFAYLIIFTKGGFWNSFFVHFLFYQSLCVYSSFNLKSNFNINNFQKSFKKK